MEIRLNPNDAAYDFFANLFNQVYHVVPGAQIVSVHRDESVAELYVVDTGHYGYVQALRITKTSSELNKEITLHTPTSKSLMFLNTPNILLYSTDIRVLGICSISPEDILKISNTLATGLEGLLSKITKTAKDEKYSQDVGKTPVGNFL